MIPIIHVDRRRNFTSSTLPEPALNTLATVFRASPFWRDAWRRPGFREAARNTLREHAGLILIGPRVKFDVPPPFSEMFEPIEIGTSLGGNRKQLMAISGDAPTKQERQMWIVWVAVGFGLLFMIGPLLFVIIRKGLPFQAAIVVMAMFAMVVLVPAIFFVFKRLGARWFLIPGAIAVVRRPVRKDQEARVTVLSRADTCLVFRIVSTGKSTIQMVELWTHLGKRLHRAVSDREAISILAAWQSTHPPPPDEQLKELVTW